MFLIRNWDNARKKRGILKEGIPNYLGYIRKVKKTKAVVTLS